MLVRCSYCDQDAIYRRRYSGEKLCGRCFRDSVLRRARHTISRYKMFKPDDHIAIAVSGGKDSIALLHVLSELNKDFAKSSLSAIIIDEGIKGYRREAVDIARENCEKLDVPLHIYPFKEIYGKSLDEIAKVAKKKGELSVCAYCGIMRRKILNLAARDVKASKLALAHNLDDELQSMVLSVVRGDLTGFGRIKPVLERMKGLIQRVKPFCELLERETAFYAYVSGIRFQRAYCPYLESSMRSDVRRFLNELELKHSGIKYGFYKSFMKIQANVKGFEGDKTPKHCTICGEIASGNVCRACQFARELDLTIEEPS